jgi:hypothetical protein
MDAPRIRGALQSNRKEQDMFGKAKALGLILTAMLAVGAMVAQAAHAEAEFTGYETEGETHHHVHSTLTITTAPGKIEKFKLGGIGTIDCHVHSTWTLVNGQIKKIGAAPIYIDPNTDKTKPYCTNTGMNESESFITDVTTNECKLVYSAGSKVGENEYTGTMEVECPAGKELDFKVTKIGSEETKCTFKIPSQSGLKHVIYKNNKESSPTDITIESTVEGLTYTSEGGLLNCGVANGVHTNGTYSGTETGQAFNEKEKQIDAEVSGE